MNTSAKKRKVDTMDTLAKKRKVDTMDTSAKKRKVDTTDFLSTSADESDNSENKENEFEESESLHSSSDEDQPPQEVRYNVPYELVSQTTGRKMGIVHIVKCDPKELVHGRELLPNEKKVLVKEVYSDGNRMEDEEDEEFVCGAFLRTNKIFLRKLCFKKSSASKKKGRGHKASKSPQKWTKSKRKQARNSGNAYMSSANKTVQAKVLKPFNCSCRYKRCKDVTQEIRENEHRKFWKKGDFNEQNMYLLNHIDTLDKSTEKAPKSGMVHKPKNKSRQYYICGINVCKELFKTVYSVSNGRLGRVLQYRDAHPDSPLKKDKRGGKNKEINPIIMKTLSEVLIKLPKYISHYHREKDQDKDDNIVYLEPSLTWKKVYEILEEEVGEKSEEVGEDLKLPRIDWFYQKVNELFPHIKTHTPSKDKCNTCSILTLQEKLEERDAHQDLARTFQKQLDKDAKKEEFFCFDLQQVQPLPLVRVNKSFYNRKMWLYNLGTNNGKQATLFLWTEIIASRGSREITSCLNKYMECFLQEHKVYDPLVAWSDSCGGQNRNFIMCCFLLRLLHENKNIKSLVHRFPVVGHSFLPNDRDFGDIEKSKRKKDAIYSVGQYVDVMKNATQKK